MTGIMSPSIEIDGDDAAALGIQPKWMLRSVPPRGAVARAMYCVMTSRGLPPRTRMAPRLRISGVDDVAASRARRRCRPSSPPGRGCGRGRRRPCPGGRGWPALLDHAVQLHEAVELEQRLAAGAASAGGLGMPPSACSGPGAQSPASAESPLRRGSRGRRRPRAACISASESVGCAWMVRDDLLGRRLEPQGHAGLGDQVGGVRADDVDAQHLVVLRVRARPSRSPPSWPRIRALARLPKGNLPTFTS